MNVNKFGRSYSIGKSLDTDLRNLIIDECLKSGGDAAFGYLPVTYVSIASRFNVSANTVSKIHGKNFRVTNIAFERFTDENMMYTQLFINYLFSKDPRKIKFFDEAGVKTPDVGTRLYGNAPSGKRCVEIVRKVKDPNFTLNLLISVNGPEYYNILDGPTDTVRFWDFFWEASQAASEVTRRPALEVGDIVVMDNLAVHHYEGGQILEEVFAEMGTELLFTPTYSPDLKGRDKTRIRMRKGGWRIKRG